MPGAHDTTNNTISIAKRASYITIVIEAHIQHQALHTSRVGFCPRQPPARVCCTFDRFLMILRSPSSLLLAHQLQIHLQPLRCSVQPVCCFNKQKTVNRRGGGIVVVRSYESRQIYHPVFLQHPWHWPPPWWGGNQRKYDVWHNSDGDDDNENGQLMFVFSYHCGDIDPILISHSEIKNGINLTEWMNFDGFLDSNLRSWLSCLALTKWSLLLGLDPNSP